MNTTTSPDLRTLASSICACLNEAAGAAVDPVWTCQAIGEYKDSNYYLKRADGLTLFLAGSAGNWAPKGKLRISLSRPHTKGSSGPTLYENGERVSDPEIGVSDTRPADEIAASIVRRLLPEAERVHKLYKDAIKRDENEDNAKLETLRLVCAAAGDKPPGENPRFHVYLLDPREDPAAYRSLASIEVRQAETVHFTLDPNRAQALALIAFLRSPAYLNA